MVRNAMSATEFYILQYLWTRETPATFSEIMVHFNEEEKKAWKKQTVNSFCNRGKSSSCTLYKLSLSMVCSNLLIYCREHCCSREW